MVIKKDYLIEKRNVLNEIRANNLSLQELRFFSIYLAKINSRDIESRLVRFSFSDFQKIMDLGRLDMKYLKGVTDNLLCKVITLVKPNGGYSSFQLFKRCNVDMDESGNWYVEIDANDDALPLMFEFKEKYFTYELWNALRLKSTNQLRMYEILKQYERVGERVISIAELKSLLGIDTADYERYSNLKIHVIDVCQRALTENTDISFTYEPTGKRGRGGKVYTLKFKIFKNENFMDQLTLTDFLNPIVETKPSFENKHLEFFSDACNNEFREPEMQLFYNMMVEIISYTQKENTQMEMFRYLKRKYDELNYQASKRKIKNRVGYLKKLIELDLE